MAQQRSRSAAAAEELWTREGGRQARARRAGLRLMASMCWSVQGRCEAESGVGLSRSAGCGSACLSSSGRWSCREQGLVIIIMGYDDASSQAPASSPYTFRSAAAMRSPPCRESSSAVEGGGRRTTMNSTKGRGLTVSTNHQQVPPAMTTRGGARGVGPRNGSLARCVSGGGRGADRFVGLCCWWLSLTGADDAAAVVLLCCGRRSSSSSTMEAGAHDKEQALTGGGAAQPMMMVLEEDQGIRTPTGRGSSTTMDNESMQQPLSPISSSNASPQACRGAWQLPGRRAGEGPHSMDAGTDGRTAGDGGGLTD